MYVSSQRVATIMSIRRTGTRRVPHGAPGAPKPKTTYQTVQQGFRELYNPQKETGSAIDVEYVSICLGCEL